MLISIKQLLSDIRSNVEIYLVGPIWALTNDWYSSGQIWASPYTWITIFWLSNLILGATLAISNKEWEPGKFLKSVTKLMIWILALLAATGVRRACVPGGFFLAGVIEAAVIFTELSYLLRNLGRIAIKLGNTNQGNILSIVADRTEHFVDSSVHAVSTSTIVGNTTTTTTDTTTTQNKPRCKGRDACGKCVDPSNCTEEDRKKCEERMRNSIIT